MELFYVQKFYNVSRGLDQSQMIIITDLIIKTYSFFDIKEIRYCFNEQMSTTRYGKVYERLDGSMIMEWLNQYYNERMDAASQMSIDEFKEVDTSSIDEYKDYKEYLAKLREKHIKEAEDFEKRKHKLFSVNPKAFDSSKEYYGKRMEEHLKSKK